MNFKYQYKSLLHLVILLVCFHGFSLLSAPQVKDFNLSLGAPRLKSNSWANLNCLFSNPDKTEEIIEVRLVDVTTGIFLFTELVSLPPKTIVKYSSIVMTGNSEKYALEIFHNGRQIGKTEVISFELISDRAKPVPIFMEVENGDLEFGSFSNLPEFKDSLKSCYFSKDVSLEQWELLKDAPFIIVLNPDFSKFSTRKFQAILDYVKQGGTLIFAHPDGIMNAMKTPLQPLLPIKPLRLRKVKRLSSMSKIIPGFSSYPEPVPFIESVPDGNGFTLIKEGKFPVVRFKKYGLGNVKVSAVPLNKDSYADLKDWKCVLKFFFSHHNFIQDTDNVKFALDEMTGFSIPGINNVLWILFSYFIIIIISIGIGLYFRKTGIAWISGGVIAVLFSFILLLQATSGISDKKGLFLSFIELIVPIGDSLSGEGYYGVMSSCDTYVNIKPTKISTIFSHLPSSPKVLKINKKISDKGQPHIEMNLKINKKMKLESPIDIRTLNGIPGISGLYLPVNFPRHFYSAFSKTNYDNWEFELPCIKYSDKLKFESWRIPPSLQAQAAWLKFPGGEIPLKIENGMVSEINRNKIFESDQVLLYLKTFLNKGWKKQLPVLVLVTKSDETLNIDLKKSVSNGKKVYMFPVNEIFTSENISIPPEYILFSGNNPSSRRVIPGNEINPAITSSNDTELMFTFQIPSALVFMEPEKFELDFKYINESGNITVEPFLLGKNKKFKEKVSTGKTGRKRKKRGNNNKQKQLYEESIKREKLTGKRISNDRFLFNRLEGVIDPISGKGIIGLKIRVKNKKIPRASRKKINTWSIKKLDIYLNGKIQLFEKNTIY